MSAEHDPPGPSQSRDTDQAEPSGSAPSGAPDGTTSSATTRVTDTEAAVDAPAEHRPAEAGPADEPTPVAAGSPESAFDRRVDLEALETLEGDLALIEAGMSHLEADDLDAAEAAVEQLRSGEGPPTP